MPLRRPQWRDDFEELFKKCLHGIGAVGEDKPQSAGGHLLETKGQSALNYACGNRLAGQKKGVRSRGAVVVHVEDGNARHTDFIQNLLAGTAVGVNPSRIGMLDFLVINTGILESIHKRLLAHFRIGPQSFGRRKFCHTDTDNINFSHFFSSIF